MVLPRRSGTKGISMKASRFNASREIESLSFFEHVRMPAAAASFMPRRLPSLAGETCSAPTRGDDSHDASGASACRSEEIRCAFDRSRSRLRGVEIEVGLPHRLPRPRPRKRLRAHAEAHQDLPLRRGLWDRRDPPRAEGGDEHAREFSPGSASRLVARPKPQARVCRIRKK